MIILSLQYQPSRVEVVPVYQSGGGACISEWRWCLYIRVEVAPVCQSGGCACMSEWRWCLCISEWRWCLYISALPSGGGVCILDQFLPIPPLFIGSCWKKRRTDGLGGGDRHYAESLKGKYLEINSSNGGVWGQSLSQL
jgi:hypothetical protein